MLSSNATVRAERMLFKQLRKMRLLRRRCAMPVSTIAEREPETSQPEAAPPAAALPFEAMPGPKSFPVIGTRWMHLPGGPLHGMSFYQKMCKMRDMYGDIIHEQPLPGFSMVHLYRPEDFETVYRNDGKYPMRLSFFMLNRYNKKYNNDIHGVIDSQGEAWHRVRSQVQQKMMKPKAVEAYFDDQAGVAEDFMALIRHNRGSDDIIDDLLPHLYTFSAEAIGVVCFNKRIGALDVNAGKNSEAQRFIRAVGDVFRATQSEMTSMFLFMYFDTPMFKRLVRAQNVIREVSIRHAQESVERVLAASAAGTEVDGEHGDLIPYLMTKTNLSEGEVMTVLADFFFAGVDTTSHMLAFILYQLCENPDVMSKLRDEVDTLLPNRKPVSLDAISSMPYLKAVVKESLRLKPVAPGNGRNATRDIIVGGYHVPKGALCALHHDIAGHEEKHFKDAAKFKPERWLRTGNQPSFHKFIFMPFGFGPRQCVGKRFAEQEVNLTLIKIIQNFNMEYCHSSDMGIEMKIINTPITPLRFRLTDRY